MDEPLEAVYTVGDTLRLQLRDGRAGVLYLEDGKPCLMLPYVPGRLRMGQS